MDFINTYKIFKPFALKFLIAISLLTVSPAQAKSDRLCPAQLQQEVEKIANSPKLQASRVGVFVQTNQSIPQVLANLDGNRYFIPASNVKLFTTATALKNLGAKYRFTTQLMSQNLPNANGELENGLWLIAEGDPSFSSATSLKSLVTQLKNKGVKRINGGIWARPSRKGSEISGSWEWQDLQEYYAALASPFTIDENALNWSIQPSTIGNPADFKWENPELASDWIVKNLSKTVSSVSKYSLQVERPFGQKLLLITGQVPDQSEIELGGVAIPNPEANFLDLLRRELIAQGIAVSNTSIKVSPVLELAIAYSPTLSELITTTNKDSNNLYAELLLRALDHNSDDVTTNSLHSGLKAINKYLQSVNIPAANVMLADGSGLSHRNLATPKAITQLLQSIASDFNFRKSLPIAGIDGTLANRFKNTAAQGQIQAKTGTLTGAIALSGYANPKNYRELIFSIMINNSNLSSKELQQYVDAIVLLLSRLEPCQ